MNLKEKVTKPLPEQEEQAEITEFAPESLPPSEETLETLPEQSQETEQQESPEPILGKFKTVDELAKSYTEQESFSTRLAQENSSLRQQLLQVQMQQLQAQQQQPVRQQESPYNPDEEFTKLSQDPRGWLAQRAKEILPQNQNESISRNLEEIQFRLAHPDWFEGDSLKPEYQQEMLSVLQAKPQYLQYPDRLNVIADKVELNLMKKGYKDVERELQAAEQTKGKVTQAKERMKGTAISATGKTTTGTETVDYSNKSLEELEKILPAIDHQGHRIR